VLIFVLKLAFHWLKIKTKQSWDIYMYSSNKDVTGAYKGK